MEDTLIKRFGNNTHNTTINRVVTEAWDRMQIRVNMTEIYFCIIIIYNKIPLNMSSALLVDKIRL